MATDFVKLLEMSHRYGSSEEYVLAGGGNTSYKDNGVLHVKCSSAQLSDILPGQFVAMDITQLLDMVKNEYPPDMSDEDREAAALAAMMAARLPGEEAKRPSVEAILHAIFPYKLVLHVHPALINGLSCGADGQNMCKRLFGERVVWIGLAKPGLILARVCGRAFEAFDADTGEYPQIAILENHGIFVAADTLEEIDSAMGYVTDRLKQCVKETPDFSDVKYNKGLVRAAAPTLRNLYSADGRAACVFCTNKQVMESVSDAAAFGDLVKPFSPDHIVYCGDEPLFLEPAGDITTAFSAYVGRKGHAPKIVAVRGLGFFALGDNKKNAQRARLLFLDAVKISVYTKSFGGAKHLPDEFTDFIVNWEAEAYRATASM